MNKTEFNDILGRLYYRYKLKISIFDEHVSVSSSDEYKMMDFRTYNSATNAHFRVIFHNNYFEQIYNILEKNNKITEFMDNLEKIILNC